MMWLLAWIVGWLVRLAHWHDRVHPWDEDGRWRTAMLWVLLLAVSSATLARPLRATELPAHVWGLRCVVPGCDVHLLGEACIQGPTVMCDPVNSVDFPRILNVRTDTWACLSQRLDGVTVDDVQPIVFRDGSSGVAVTHRGKYSDLQRLLGDVGSACP